MKPSSKNNNINNEREKKLIEGIVELISIFPGINQNSLRRKLVDEEKLAAKSTFEDRIKILVSDGVIEGKKGKGQETNYYISGLGDLHKEVNDDKFAKELIKITDIITQIESNSRDFSEQTMEQAFGIMREIQSKGSMVISWYDDEQNLNSNEEDVMLEEIKNYGEEYPHESIINEVTQASEICSKIKSTNNEKSTIIKQMIKSRSPPVRTKLIKKLIENRRANKKQLGNLKDIWKNMPDQKHLMQKRVFMDVVNSLNEKIERKQPFQKVETLRKLHIILRELPKQETGFVSSFRNIIDSSEEPLKTKLNNLLGAIRIPFKDGSGYAGLLRDVISSLEKEISKPIKKNILIKKLVETNLFSKHDAVEMISHMSFGGPIFESEDGIYKIKFFV